MKSNKIICIIMIFLMVIFAISVSAIDSDEYTSMLNELNSLVAQCKQKGIETDYEKMNIAVFERFIGYIALDKQQVTNIPPLAYSEGCLSDLYTKTKQNLLDYLSGKSAPKEVSGYNIHDAQIAENSLKTSSGKPVYSVGYGHFDQAVTDIPNFNDFGTNNIQMEIGPQDVLRSGKGIGYWKLDLAGNAADNIWPDADFNIVDSDNTGKALKIVNRTALHNNVYISLSQNVELTAGETYTFGCSIKGGGISGRPWISLSDTGFGDRKTILVGSNWQTVEYTLTPTTSNLIFRFVVENLAQELYVDNFYLHDSSGKNILLDGGFENGITISDDFYSVYGNASKKVVSALQTAQDNNVAVCLLLSPHYFPEFMYTLYPEISGNGNYIKYNIDYPAARRAIEAYLRAIIPVVKDYSSLGSICISNEPTYSTLSYSSFYTPLFQSYLEQKHGNITALNLTLGTSYTSFSEIQMPQNIEETPLYYEWICFNDDTFSSWHSWMVNIIKQFTDIPLISKAMMNIFPSDSDFLRRVFSWGTDIEQFVSFSDMAGNDSTDYLSNPNDFLNKMKWYDFLTSISDKPIYNCEDHIIADGDVNYDALQAKHVYSDIWEGAVHGRNLSTVWVWNRSYDTSSASYGSILHRPDCVANVGKVSLDLNRLSYEVDAFHSKQPDVAILYSGTSRLYEKSYMNVLDTAYRSAVFDGQKVGFVTEDGMEKLANYKLLIIPNATNVKADTLLAIQNFAVNGGNVIVLGTNSLGKNEYEQLQNNTVLADVMTRATVIPITVSGYTCQQPTVSSLQLLLNQEFSENGLSDIMLVDAQTGGPLENVVWQTAAYKNENLIDICNLDRDENKSITILKNGVEIAESEDLIEKTGNDKTFNASLLTPKLIAIQEENKETIDALQATTQDNKLYLTWQTGYGFKKANIYELGADMNLSYIKSVFGTSFFTDIPTHPTTYVVKAVNYNEKETEGRVISYPINENLFQIQNAVITQNEFLTLVADFENTTAYPLKGCFCVIFKDANNNIISQSIIDKVVKPNQTVNFSWGVQQLVQPSAIDILVWDSSNSKNPMAIPYTINN